MTGPALSVAKALAAEAPWDNFLASLDVVQGQENLAELWKPEKARQPFPSLAAIRYCSIPSLRRHWRQCWGISSELRMHAVLSISFFSLEGILWVQSEASTSCYQDLHGNRCVACQR